MVIGIRCNIWQRSSAWGIFRKTRRVLICAIAGISLIACTVDLGKGWSSENTGGDLDLGPGSEEVGHGEAIVSGQDLTATLIARGRSVRFLTWSPSGDTIAARIVDNSSQEIRELFGYGPIAIYDVVRDRLCFSDAEVMVLPDFREREMFSWESESLVVNNSLTDSVTKVDDCKVSELPISYESEEMVRISPNGKYEARTTLVEKNGQDLTVLTELKNFGSKEILAQALWNPLVAHNTSLDSVPRDGQWVTSDKYAILNVQDAGALVLDVDGGRKILADEFEMVSINQSVTSAVRVDEEDDYIVEIYAASSDDRDKVYCSRSGLVRTIDSGRLGGVSPDGKWLVILEDGNKPDSSIVNIEPVSACGATSNTAVINPVVANQLPVVWSIDSSTVAIGTTTGIMMISPSGAPGEPVSAVPLIKEDGKPVAWSPTGSQLLIWSADANGESLRMIRRPN